MHGSAFYKPFAAITYPAPLNRKGSLSTHFPPSSFAKCFSSSLNGSMLLASMRSIMTMEAKQTVWLWTRSKDVMTVSVERGWDTFIFTPETQYLFEEWSSIANIRPLFLNNGQLCDSTNKQVALFKEVPCPKELQDLETLSRRADIVVVDIHEGQIVSTENMVAFFQNIETSIFGHARSASEAKMFFESLERGTDGVVLRTDEPSEVFELKAYLASHVLERVSLLQGTVQRVEMMGMGDRVCVDLCSILKPGEGLLVGSFARGLFLVHSECRQTNYVASRPFRVNAGPVHAYVATPGGRTAYLAELQSGMQVVVVDANGVQRSAIVGRVKIETRPLILIEVLIADTQSSVYSILLQNAETVSLVRPPSTGVDAQSDLDLAVPVTALKVGDNVLLSVQNSARHTGVKIEEFIVEK